MSSAYPKPDTCRQHRAALNGGMTYSKRARTTTRRIPRIFVAGPLVVLAAIAAALGYQSLASSSSTAASPPIDVLRSSSPSRSSSRPIPSTSSSRSEHRRPLGEADGALPDGTTVFDDELPGVANLDPALLGALRQAATDAADDGVELFVDSGWRSAEYQEQLLHEAVSKYGSEEEADRWVATPNTSAHVSGDAVDIGPSDAAAWLSEHGAEYGLCRIYSNEPWHYELRPEAINHGCPAMYADPTHDPRMRQ
jgi:zinc D-Ala-D-Ala carboxypeptidase